jgi:hypothetical protein
MGLGEGGRKRAAVMWYLVGLPSYKNLVEAVELTLARCRTEIRNGAFHTFSEEERKVVEPTSVFPPSLFLLRIGNPLPMPALRESVSLDVRNGLIAMNKSLPFVRKGWGMRRLLGASVSLPERESTGRKKAPSQKQNDGENDQVVLIPTPPMCSPDGSKGARMGRNCFEKSKRKAIRDRNDRFIASCFLYARKCASSKKRRAALFLCKISPPRMPFGCLCVILSISMKKSKSPSWQFVRRARQPG